MEGFPLAGISVKRWYLHFKVEQVFLYQNKSNTDKEWKGDENYLLAKHSQSLFLSWLNASFISNNGDDKRYLSLSLFSLKSRSLLFSFLFDDRTKKKSALKVKANFLLPS